MRAQRNLDFVELPLSKRAINSSIFISLSFAALCCVSKKADIKGHLLFMAPLCFSGKYKKARFDITLGK